MADDPIFGFINKLVLGTLGGEAVAGGVGLLSSGLAPDAIISAVAQGHASTGIAGLSAYMSDAELQLVLEGSPTAPAIMGQAVHSATADTLEALYPGQFQYFSRAAFDFLFKPTGEVFELTTVGQAAAHAGRGANLVFYGLFGY